MPHFAFTLARLTVIRPPAATHSLGSGIEAKSGAALTSALEAVQQQLTNQVDEVRALVAEVGRRLNATVETQQV